MGKGRKILPDNIKKLKGTEQPCRKNENGVEVPMVNELPQTPPFLNSFGKRIYRNVGKNLLDAGVLNEINLMMFTALCREYGIYWEAEEQMVNLSDRYEISTDKSGNQRTVPSAVHQISKMALQNARMIAVEFGLTPASLSKIAAPKKSNTPTIEDFLK